MRRGQPETLGWLSKCTLYDTAGSGIVIADPSAQYATQSVEALLGAESHGGKWYTTAITYNTAATSDEAVISSWADCPTTARR